MSYIHKYVTDAPGYIPRKDEVYTLPGVGRAICREVRRIDRRRYFVMAEILPER